MIVFVISTIVFLLPAFGIVWGMFGYKESLKLIGKKYTKSSGKVAELSPFTVTVMIVAHNEEKVIEQKLKNVINNDYDHSKIEYLVASDNSTDSTNDIVNAFISSHPDIKLRLYISKEHKGKTNAQNEAQKTVFSDILVMTDANSMFEENTISELVGSFSSPDIAYVTGRLSYSNADDNSTSNAENAYWEGDLAQRKVESSLHSVTAGNGAVYACRNSLYHDFDPVECHDSSMPPYYVQRGYRAIYNENAVAYEKAGETNEDEFKRKVRMNRIILKEIKDSFKLMNPFKYKWFSYCWFGHRFCRYTLWLSHIVVVVSNIALVLTAPKRIINDIAKIILALQTTFYLIALIGKLTKSSNKYIHMVYYYVMTITAQVIAVKRALLGQSKPTWDKAESTR